MKELLVGAVVGAWLGWAFFSLLEGSYKLGKEAGLETCRQR